MTGVQTCALPICAEFGYRLFDVNLVDGPSTVDLGLRGLFAGLAVRF